MDWKFYGFLFVCTEFMDSSKDKKDYANLCSYNFIWIRFYAVIAIVSIFNHNETVRPWLVVSFVWIIYEELLIKCNSFSSLLQPKKNWSGKEIQTLLSNFQSKMLRKTRDITKGQIPTIKNERLNE